MNLEVNILNSLNLEDKTADFVLDWGKTLIAAPHPDDESLGCGGAIALLKKHHREAFILTISDGTLSHPNSVKFPADKLRRLRESEMVDAVEILGVDRKNLDFLRFPDRNVPDESSSGFDEAVKLVRDFLHALKPQTILIPWRRDPHPDHRATWQIFRRAGSLSEDRFRFLEYPIWLWEMAEITDLPETNNFAAFRLDIAEVVEKKQRAVNAHLSQVSDLIDDDPNGFRLSPEVLAHFSVPFEIYLEEIK